MAIGQYRANEPTSGVPRVIAQGILILVMGNSSWFVVQKLERNAGCLSLV